MLSEYPNARPQIDAIVVNVGSDQDPIYIPSNLLQVLPGNRYCRALFGQQQTTMITAACRPARRDDTPTNRLRSNRHLISTTGLSLLGMARPLWSDELVKRIVIALTRSSRLC